MGRRQGLRGRLVLLLMAAALVGGLLPPFAPPAQAASLVLSPTCTMPGGSVSASGSGAPPGLYVTFHMPQAMGGSSLQVPVGSTRADKKGNFRGSFTVPLGLAAGSYTIEARWAQGLGSGLLGTATLTLVAEATACPQPPATEEAYPPVVLDISMVSPTDGWAVMGGTDSRKLWHYDGTAWSEYPQDFPPGTVLNSIYMLSATDGWTAGYRLGDSPGFYRYDGQSWTLYKRTEFVPWSVHFTSPTDGWAAAYYFGEDANRIYHFDGKEWSLHSTVPGES
ncbi:MAG: hypothetical protein Q8O76_12695, partial [Chloroflexota bacterium]|nr:hypothetical protein [Chloroflexota bacterium]